MRSVDLVERGMRRTILRAFRSLSPPNVQDERSPAMRAAAMDARHLQKIGHVLAVVEPR